VTKRVELNPVRNAHNETPKSRKPKRRTRTLPGPKGVRRTRAFMRLKDGERKIGGDVQVVPTGSMGWTSHSVSAVIRAAHRRLYGLRIERQDHATLHAIANVQKQAAWPRSSTRSTLFDITTPKKIGVKTDEYYQQPDFGAQALEITDMLVRRVCRRLDSS